MYFLSCEEIKTFIIIHHHEDLSGITKSTQFSRAVREEKGYLTKTRQSNLKMKNNLPWKLQPTCDGTLWKNITCTDRRIERPLHISLLNSSQKASRYAKRRQINSADDSIAACKLQKVKRPCQYLCKCVLAENNSVIPSVWTRNCAASTKRERLFWARWESHPRSAHPRCSGMSKIG